MNDNEIPAGTPVVIIAGAHFNECGTIADDVSASARQFDVLIGSPGHFGQRVTVRRTSVEVFS